MKSLAIKLPDNFPKRFYGFAYINTLCWIIYTVYLYFIYSYIIPAGLKFSHMLMVFSVGYLTTIVLHLIYGQIKYSPVSGSFRDGIYIALLLLLLGNFWWWSTRFLSVLVYPLPSISDVKTLKGLFSRELLEYNIRGILDVTIQLAIWSGIYMLAGYRRRWKKQVESTEKAIVLAQNAHLQLIQYQIDPHFLFNALNSIRALIGENKKAAKEVVSVFSEYLKYSLVTKDYSDVPLSAEIEIVKYYVAIERCRFGSKLDVTFDIDPAACNYPVISFLIDPLIEHLIKFGFRTNRPPLKINLSAEIINHALSLRISSFGQWNEVVLLKDKTFDNGLNNVRQRLEIAYPGSHVFKVKESVDCIIIEILIHSSRAQT